MAGAEVGDGAPVAAATIAGITVAPVASSSDESGGRSAAVDGVSELDFALSSPRCTGSPFIVSGSDNGVDGEMRTET